MLIHLKLYKEKTHAQTSHVVTVCTLIDTTFSLHLEFEQLRVRIIEDRMIEVGLYKEKGSRQAEAFDRC